MFNIIPYATDWKLDTVIVKVPCYCVEQIKLLTKQR